MIKLSWSALWVKIGSSGDILRQAFGVAAGNGHFRAMFRLPPLGFGFDDMVHTL